MSSNLNPSIPSSNHRSAAAHAVDALSGVSPAASVGRGHAESDSQAFARWMAQYTQSSMGAGGAATPTAPGNKQAAANPALRETAQKADQPPAQTRHVDVTVSPSAAAPANHEAASANSGPPARPAVKGPAKAATSKTPEAPRREAKADKADKAPGDATDVDASAKDEGLGEAVDFTTAQGEATAYVRELQPPANVPTSDPAAMLAWLATLTQARGMAPQADAAAPDAATDGQGPSGQVASPLSTVGMGGDAGHSAQPSWSVLGAGQDQTAFAQDGGKDSGQGGSDKEGALSLEGLGMTAVKDTTALPEAASFGALMGQALQRTSEGVSRQEPTHHTASLPTPLDSPEFPQAMADRIGLWVAGAAQDGPMTAELRLNPAEMGPVHIRIELDGQTANVDFAAAALETRQAIEASLSHLSEALAEAGLSLSGGGVSDQPQQQAWAQAQGQPDAGSGRGRGASISGPSGLNAEAPGGTTNPTRLPRGRAGGLDLYA
jgi:flagellar hook-length control protein FliK